MTPELVLDLARRLYGINLSSTRATELAQELARLSACAHKVGERLEFDLPSYSHQATVSARVLSSTATVTQDD